MERAKELFLKYGGNRFHMDREGDGAEYDSCRVPAETEELWAEEAVSRFLEGKTRGKEALRAYSLAVELLDRDRRDRDRDACLFWPLRAEHLDDVTALFMLGAGFRMAERAAAKGRFSREEAERYLSELRGYARQVRERSETGTLTRSADYVLGEFSDPVYVKQYLKDLEEKWSGLLRSCPGQKPENR